MHESSLQPFGQRFRGFLPVVIDVETGGFNPLTDALLEIAAVILTLDEEGRLHPVETVATQVKPFAGAKLEPASLEVNGINPWHPLRIALPEKDALEKILKPVRTAVKLNQCTRAILVGHNAHFDLAFLNAAVGRTELKRNPFHPFSSLDTVSLGALTYGQTVLSRLAEAAHLGWDERAAHSAVYDAEKTAALFCTIFNRWHRFNERDHPGASSTQKNAP